jgi:hypothetical protein
MAHKKKYQVFISSTYIDLKSERQAAVEAILSGGHISAGMELFAAGDETQAAVIRRWIDESDIFMLILGGRYGTIDPQTKKSYIEAEYDYAIEKDKPYFSLVISEKALEKKKKELGVKRVGDEQEYEQFRKKVLSKISKFYEDEKDIKICIFQSINEITTKYDLMGWVRGDEILDYQNILKENAELRKNIAQIDEKVRKYERSTIKEHFGEYTYSELKKVLMDTPITIPKDTFGINKDTQTSLLKVFTVCETNFNVGVDNSEGSDADEIFLFYNVAPKLQSLGLVEKPKTPPSSMWQRMQTSALGLKFLRKYNYRKKSKHKKKSIGNK